MRKKDVVRNVLAVLLVCGLLTTMIATAGCGKPTVNVATTNTIASSPMYKALIEEYESRNNVTVVTEAFDNSKEVLEAGTEGAVDALLVTKNAGLEDWMKKGLALSAEDVFYCKYVVVGPDSDPAQIRGLDCPGKSCKKIGTAGQAFVACGDGSDLDTKVMGYWSKNGIDPVGQAWFTKTGKGVVETLRVADRKQAYTIVDTSTWLAHQDEVSLKKLVEGCSMLLNQYAVVLVNPDKVPDAKINAEGASTLAQYMLSEDGQDIAGEYKEADVIIFTPNATKTVGGEGSN
jgi:tungstate transport system substrate-binding protein